MNTMRTQAGLLALAALATACNVEGRLLDSGTPALASSSGVPFAEGLASPEWQHTAVSLVAQAAFNPQTASRAYALLGVAQYLAVQRAEGAAGGGRRRLESDRGAVAGASVVVLSYLFPGQAQALEDLVVAQAQAGPGDQHPAFAAAEAIGRTVGGEIVTRAQTDGFNQPFTGSIPSGPGLWISNTNPPTMVAGQLPKVTPWFLTSADQFRPGPPPAFGSAEFQAALGEIRGISDTRTAEQTQIAAYWAMNPGTPTPPGFWLGVATDGVREHGLSEREATHVYALLSAAVFDALIGCWDAKETYWFIRPWQADSAITVVPAVGKPNHPSYPSGHACVSRSAAAVLATFFPEEQADLDAIAMEAGLSRLYAGIHYRFDIVAGAQLGRSVAALAIAADASGNSVLTSR
jgi:membrane-associated phospholipid phosphatase